MGVAFFFMIVYSVYELFVMDPHRLNEETKLISKRCRSHHLSLSNRCWCQYCLTKSSHAVKVHQGYVMHHAEQANILRFIWFDFHFIKCWPRLNGKQGIGETKHVQECLCCSGCRLKMLIDSALDWHQKQNIKLSLLLCLLGWLHPPSSLHQFVWLTSGIIKCVIQADVSFTAVFAVTVTCSLQ